MAKPEESCDWPKDIIMMGRGRGRGGRGRGTFRVGVRLGIRDQGSGGGIGHWNPKNPLGISAFTPRKSGSCAVAFRGSEGFRT